MPQALDTGASFVHLARRVRRGASAVSPPSTSFPTTVNLDIGAPAASGRSSHGKVRRKHSSADSSGRRILAQASIVKHRSRGQDWLGPLGVSSPPEGAASEPAGTTGQPESPWVLWRVQLGLVGGGDGRIAHASVALSLVGDLWHPGADHMGLNST